MKLVKIALTPPIIAISVFAFFALTARADLQNLLTVAKTQGTPTITGNNVWSSKFANLFNGVTTKVDDNERWMTGNPADAAGIGWTSIARLPKNICVARKSSATKAGTFAYITRA